MAGPNLRFPPAMMLPVVLAVLAVAVPSHPHGLSAPLGCGRAVGCVRAGAPVPDWAREGAWLCWSLIPVAVLLPAGRCLGAEGVVPCSRQHGQARCLPCWLLAQQPPAVIGEEASLIRAGSLREGRASWVGRCSVFGDDPKTCCWLQHFVSDHTDSMGTGATQRLHSRKLLFCFVPDVFQRKTLGRAKGKCGEGGGTGVCISHLPLAKVQDTWAGAMPVTGGLLRLVSLCPAAPSLQISPTLIWQGRGEPLALWPAHPDAAAPAFTLPAAA